MKPIVYDYMDVRHYLNDFFKHKKLEDPKFSYGTWCLQLGFKNKTLLRLILLGKRKITESTKIKFSNFLGLEQRAEEYFFVLIDYSQTKSAIQKNALGQQLIHIQRSLFKPHELRVESGILNDCYCPMVLTLVNSSRLPLNVQTLSDILTLPYERVEEILNYLVANGQIKIEDNRVLPVHSTFKVSDSFKNDALRRYYSYWLQQSVEAINLPSDIRRFRSLQILLNEEEFQKINESFHGFVLENLSRFESNSLEERRLYVVNSSIFPVTDVLSDER